jgi:hypothetical protein
MTTSVKAPPRRLDVADVVVLLMPSYWTRAGLSLFAATRYCAIVALLSCCHLGLFIQRNIKTANWRPNGRDVVIVRRFGKTQEVPLTPQVIYVVERYLKERERARAPKGTPLWTSEYLFVTPGGKRPFVHNMVKTFRRVERAAGLDRPLEHLLVRFCAKSLEKGGDQTASRRFRGLTKKLGARHVELAELSIEKLARFGRAINPFRTLDRQVRGEIQAARYLSKKDTVVPKILGRKKCELPVEEPVVAELMAVKWPKARRERKALLAQLRDEHGAAIEELLAKGRITYELVGSLFGVTSGSIHSFHRDHYRRAVPAKLRRPAQRPEKAKVSAAEKTLLKSLAGNRRPLDKVEAKAKSRASILAHYPVVHDMISRRLLTTFEAAELFGISRPQLLRLRAAVSAGQSVDEAMTERTYSKVSDDWLARLREEHGKRPEGETDLAFCFRMQAAGFPACRDQFKIHLRRIKASATISEAEHQLVETLSKLEWPKDVSATNSLRRELLLAHFDRVDALLDAGKIVHRHVADLFKVPTATIEYIRAARKAGLTVEEAVIKNPRAEIPNGVWPAIREEHERSPTEKDRPFYFRMRIQHGFPGSEKQMMLFRLGLRRAAAEAPASIAA